MAKIEKIPEFNIDQFMKAQKVTQKQQREIDPELAQFMGNEKICNASMSDIMSIDETEKYY